MVSGWTSTVDGFLVQSYLTARAPRESDLQPVYHSPFVAVRCLASTIAAKRELSGKGIPLVLANLATNLVAQGRVDEARCATVA